MNIARVAKYKIELSEEELTNLNNALSQLVSAVSDHTPQDKYTQLVNNRTIDRVVAFRTLIFNGLDGR